MGGGGLSRSNTFAKGCSKGPRQATLGPPYMQVRFGAAPNALAERGGLGVALDDGVASARSPDHRAHERRQRPRAPDARSSAAARGGGTPPSIVSPDSRRGGPWRITSIAALRRTRSPRPEHRSREIQPDPEVLTRVVAAELAREPGVEAWSSAQIVPAMTSSSRAADPVDRRDAPGQATDPTGCHSPARWVQCRAFRAQLREYPPGEWYRPQLGRPAMARVQAQVQMPGPARIPIRRVVAEAVAP